MAKTETIQEIADRLEISVEGDSSSDKEESEEKQPSPSFFSKSINGNQAKKEGDSSSSSDEDGDMQEDLTEGELKENPVEEEFKAEGEEIKIVDFIRDAKIKKQEVLQRTLERRLTKNQQTSKAKGKINSDKAGYTKPDYGIDREKERKLLHAATKGVVQLFNAVSERQVFLDKQLEELSTGNRIQRRQTMEKIKSYDFKENLKKPSINPKRMKVLKEDELKNEVDSISSFENIKEDDCEDSALCGSFGTDQDKDDDFKEEWESSDISY